MGYIFLLIATFFNASKGFCSKKISNSVITLRDNLNVSLFRNVICAIISFLILALEGQKDLSLSLYEIILCSISGVSLAVFMSSWIFSIRSESYMLSSAFASSSFVVPSLIGVLLLNERFTVTKTVSFLLIIAALFFLLRYNTQLNGKIKVKQLLLLLTVLLSQGINQSVQKIYTENFPFREDVYTLYSSLFTIAAVILIMPFTKSSGDPRSKTLLKGKNLFYISVMAIGLFGYTFFLTLASGSGIDAIILYPLTNALSLISLAVVASIFFGERLKRDSIIGIALVFAALITNNIK